MIRKRTIQIPVESFDSESIRESWFVLVDVNFKMTLNKNWGVIVDILNIQSELHRISKNKLKINKQVFTATRL